MVEALTRRWRALLFAVTVAIAVTAGFAYATVPDANGVIHACYRVDKKGEDDKGQVRIVDSARDCKKNEQHITWNQRGPQGETGPTGPPGGGTASLTSPNGLFKIEITNAGVVISGPGGTIHVDYDDAAVASD